MRKALWIAAAAFLLTSGAGVAAEKAPEKEKRNDEATYRLLNLFGDVFEQVRANYVDEIGDDKLIEAAITGMLSSLDPHSSYMNAKSYKDMQVQTRGNFGGLGIEVSMENGLVKVVSPIANRLNPPPVPEMPTVTRTFSASLENSSATASVMG